MVTGPEAHAKTCFPPQMDTPAAGVCSLRTSVSPRVQQPWQPAMLSFRELQPRRHREPRLGLDWGQEGGSAPQTRPGPVEGQEWHRRALTLSYPHSSQAPPGP